MNTLLVFGLILARVLAEGTNEVEPLELTAQRGSYVVFDCELEFPQNFEIPYVVDWTKDNDRIYMRSKDGPKVFPGYEGRISDAVEGGEYGKVSINLTDVQESDVGLYECKVIFPNRSPSTRTKGTFYNLKLDEGDAADETTTAVPMTTDEVKSTEPEPVTESIGPPRNLTIHLNTGGYLLSWSPPDFGVEHLRVYVVRMFKTSFKYLVSSKETHETQLIIDDLDEEEIYHFQVSSMTNNDLDVPGDMIAVHIPAFGKIRLVVAGVGCILLVVLVAAVIWYSKIKSSQVSEAKNGKSAKGEA